MMKSTKTIPLGLALSLSAGVAFGGGMDRSGQNVSALFEEGMVSGFSFANVTPSITGKSYGGVDTSNIAPEYSQFGSFFKADAGNAFSYAIIFDQPFGANVEYPTDSSPVVAGAKAEISSYAITLLGQYNFPNNFSIYGGPRIQTLKGSYQIPTFGTFANGAPTGLPAALAGYDLKTKENTAYGFALGVAYEKPEIALRVSLTYNSAIEHKIKTTETAFKAPYPLASSLDDTMDVTTPQSINLDFQTGVNEKTLIFGGMRWVKWTETELKPALYDQIIKDSVISYDTDTITYSFGVGRKLTDTWSLAGSVGYEAATGDDFSNLSPTDGKMSAGLAAIYDDKRIRVQGGLNYTSLGDADDAATGRDFKNNTAMGVGLSVSYRY